VRRKGKNFFYIKIVFRQKKSKIARKTPYLSFFIRFGDGKGTEGERSRRGEIPLLFIMEKRQEMRKIV
ncbi:MAG: hypothetical protein LBR34_04510, partial [Prevotella sp.]|nr:hypothetical protein [Prevotella sp.]